MCRSPHLKIKLDMFKQYIEKLRPNLTECEKQNNYDEPLTCGNDELRKLMFFYEHPELYALYKDNQVIIDFFLQSRYHDYHIQSKENKNSSSNYLSLSIKYSFYLIILLLF